MRFRSLLFALLFLPISAFVQQPTRNFGATLQLIKKDGSLIQGGVVYGGDQVQGVIHFDPTIWDGESRFYPHVFIVTNGKLQPLYPDPNPETHSQFPIKNADGGYVHDHILFSGVISPPFGTENFILLMTERPISNWSELFRSTPTRGSGISTEELMKLVKGSKLSTLSDPTLGAYTISTLQLESHPPTEKAGLSTGVEKKLVFALPDSTEIFTMPRPQAAIVRDSFATVEIIDPVISNDSRGLSIQQARTINIRGIAAYWRNSTNQIRQISINGKPATTFRPTSGYFDFLYEPVEGSNLVEIRVETYQGFARTRRIKFQYKPASKEVSPEGKDHLFVIGINQYTNWPRLNNAAKDAIDFSNLMTGQYAFDKGNVTQLLNERATRKEIYTQLRSYVERLGSNDRLLVYFAGHGYYDSVLQMGYWIPVDAVEGSDDEYINNIEITRMFQKMKAKNIFVIADACYSGQLLRDMQREGATDYRSRMLLCSGKLKPVPDGTPGSNSPFAAQLLTYLRNPTKKAILASDLIHHIKQSFGQVSTQKPVGGAIDEVGDENGDFVLNRKNTP